MLAEKRRRGQAAPLHAGQLIRQIREQAKLTPRQLCREIAMNLGQLSDIERGIQHLSLRRARQMATVFGSPFDEVVRLVLQDKVQEAGFTDLRVKISVASNEEARVSETVDPDTDR